jgi:cysteine dioxygenase
VLEEFVQRFRRTPPQLRSDRELARLFEWAAGTGADLEEPLVTRPSAYTRTCAFKDERFEVLLLNWAPGAASRIHDHGGQLCWFTVLEGALQVDDYVRLDDARTPGHAAIEATGSEILAAGGIDLRSGEFDIHSVRTVRERAVSLHVYARPLDGYYAYDLTGQTCQPVHGRYDATLSLFGDAEAMR